MKTFASRSRSADNVSIAFDHYQNPSEKLIIIAPGFYNSKAALLLKDLAQALAPEYDCIAFDFRGHGQSGGVFSWGAKEYMDMQAVLQYAAKSYGAIGVIGFSLGAGTSLITAARSQLIKSVIAVSAPSDFGKIDYRFWELDFENDIRYSLLSEGRIGKGARPGPFWLPKEKPLTAAAQLRVPVLYIHGTRDWVVKPWHSQALLAQTVSKKRLQVIQDGPHAEYLLRRHREQLIRSSREWFKETL